MTSCQCIDANMGEYNDFEVSRVHTAKKEHTCGECGRTITPGEQYEYVFAGFEGELSTYKTCSDCLSLRKTLFCAWCYNGVWESLEAEIQQWVYTNRVPWAALAQLTPAARERVLEIIEDYYDADEREGFEYPWR